MYSKIHFRRLSAAQSHDANRLYVSELSLNKPYYRLVAGNENVK